MTQPFSPSGDGHGRPAPDATAAGSHAPAGQAPACR